MEEEEGIKMMKKKKMMSTYMRMRGKGSCWMVGLKKRE